MPYDSSKWRPLDLSDEYSAGHAYHRLQLLMSDDPYLAMLSERTQNALALLFFSENVLGDSCIFEDCRTRSRARDTLFGALDDSALAMLLTERFKAHIVHLVLTTMFINQEAG